MQAYALWGVKGTKEQVAARPADISQYSQAGTFHRQRPTAMQLQAARAAGSALQGSRQANRVLGHAHACMRMALSMHTLQLLFHSAPAPHK